MITENHPYIKRKEPSTAKVAGGFLPVDAKVLIVGTFPPKKNSEQEIRDFFFYSSPLNQFWNRIDNIFMGKFDYKELKWNQKRSKEETKEENNNRLKEFSEKYKLAFLDFFVKVSRLHNTSKDIDLVNVENIVENGVLENYLDFNQSLMRICCTYKRAYLDLTSSLK